MVEAWKILTGLEIDRLEGWDLSEAVGNALPWLQRLSEPGIGWRGWRRGYETLAWYEWRPHEDANQALKVWNELLELDDSYTLEMDASGTGIFSPKWPAEESTRGTFYTTVCRAYLRAMLESNSPPGRPLAGPVPRGGV